MTVGLQGTWIVSVKTKAAAWAQQFKVEGSTNGQDGTYAGVTTTPAFLVDGEQWGITIENDPAGAASWRPSRCRLGNFRTETGFFKVDIESDDGGGGPDEDFNDLVLTIAKPLSSSEWIVYGTAKKYKGFCKFNPCSPYPWVVVDTADQLRRLLKYDEIRPIFERIYGANVAAMADREHFKPLVISRGGATPTGLVVEGSTAVELKKRGKSKVTDVATLETAAVVAAKSHSYEADITAAEASVIGKLISPQPCEVEPIALALMRMAEYDRSAAELGGGPYEGFGDRETLGVTATDEFGNYVFSFTRTLEQIIDEATTDVPAGGDATVAGRPDFMFQFVDDPEGIAFYETMPYYDIANVQRIDLCIRAKEFLPKPCRGDRVMQYLGDIPIVNNPGSTLFADGTITNIPSISESGPAVTHGAWNGVLDIFGCFEGSVKPVTHYVVRYRAGALNPWNYLTVPARGLRQQGTGTWKSESYGPETTTIMGSDVPAYRNIELETGWSLEVEHRKVRVNLESLLSPDLPRKVDDVWITIRGYDEDGDPVLNTYDAIRLRVDAERSVGTIESITLPGGEDPGPCAMLDLPSDATALDIRLRALDADGFLRDWWLGAIKGSNTVVEMVNAPQGAYPGEDVDDRFYGTAERSTADIDGYVTFNVAPVGGWLQTVSFCAFSFELYVRDRTTNGKTVPTARKVWDEVIGMRLTS